MSCLWKLLNNHSSIFFFKAAFDHAYSVGILRVKTRLDFSDHIKSVETEDGDAGTPSFPRKEIVIAFFENCIGVSSH